MMPRDASARHQREEVSCSIGRETKPTRRALAVILAGLLILFVLGIGVLLWQSRDDPIAALPKSSGTVLNSQHEEVRIGRLFRHVILSDERLGHIGFTVSLPEPVPERRLPLVIVLGGAGTGENNIRFVESVGDNVVVGYDWPLPTPLPKGLRLAWKLPSLRGHVLSVPGQIAAMLDWLAMQPWSDPERISMLGFSLGALAVPAAERVSDREGVHVQWTVLAYGGVGFGTLVAGDQRIRPSWLRPLLGAGAELFLSPLEPAAHLPRLAGRFLILGAAHDTIVDPQAAAKLEELAPRPKTIIHTNGDHIGTGVNRRELLVKAMAATRQWLITEGAVNPSTQ
jgi:hypothetical protein